MAGFVVFFFLFYQLVLIKNGTTSKIVFIDVNMIIANESFKWDDLKYAIDSKELTDIDITIMKYNQNYKKGDLLSDYHEESSQHIPNSLLLPPSSVPSTSYVSQDPPNTATSSSSVMHRKKAAKLSTILDSHNVRITSVSMLRNIYDEGWQKNFFSIFFPAFQKELLTSKASKL